MITLNVPLLQKIIWLRFPRTRAPKRLVIDILIIRYFDNFSNFHIFRIIWSVETGCDKGSVEILIFPKLISTNTSQIRSGLNDGIWLTYHQLYTRHVIYTIYNGHCTKQSEMRPNIINIHHVYRPTYRQAFQLTLARLNSLFSVDNLIYHTIMRSTCSIWFETTTTTSFILTKRSTIKQQGLAGFWRYPDELLLLSLKLIRAIINGSPIL